MRKPVYLIYEEYIAVLEIRKNAYKITLVAAFTPLAFGLYWKRATTLGAAAGIVLGLAIWILLEVLNPEAYLPPQFAGLLAAMTGMIAGSLLPQRYGVEHHHHPKTS